MDGVKRLGFGKMLNNGFGLGEVAEPKSQIEKLNLIIKKEC
jgi:hypothetical protein